MNAHQRGFTLVELMVVVALIGTIAAMAVPNLIVARMAANEASTIASLRTIVTVNEQYRSRFGVYSGSLEDLEDVGYLDNVLGSGRKSGFEFSYIATPIEWQCTAQPLSVGRSGQRNFYVDESGVIRHALERDANVESLPIE